MDLSTIVFLAQDGIVQGTIYSLLAVALVLIFSVTRIIFVPQGDFVAYGGLTLASIQLGFVPGTIWILICLSAFATVFEAVKAQSSERSLQAALRPLGVMGFAVALLALCRSLSLRDLHVVFQIVVTLAIVAPIGPLIYRVAFEPLAASSELVLLIAAVAVHFIMIGAGLLAFGAEGFRTAEIVTTTFVWGDAIVSGQSLAILGFGLFLIAVLFVVFRNTMPGKALMATAINRTGARLVGIDLASSGRLCFSVAATIGAVSGILISSVTTLYYDSGFLVSLKGFVAAILGGLASYPLTATGALAVGLIESFSSFWASAFKEAILFSLIIPILLSRRLLTKNHAGDRP